MGAQPLAWMQASLGRWSIRAMSYSSLKPFQTPTGPKPPLTDWIYQSGARSLGDRGARLEDGAVWPIGRALYAEPSSRTLSSCSAIS